MAGGQWKNLLSLDFHRPLATRNCHFTPQFGCGWAALGCADKSRDLLLRSTVAILCLFVPTVAAACLHDDNSWTQTSPGGEYILVMVSSRPVADDEGNRPLDATPGAPCLRDKYRESGLYRNDGSRQPLWPIPFVSRAIPAHVAPDGTCVVFDADLCDLGPHAVTMYVDGRHVVTYLKYDLIPCYDSKRILAMLCHRKGVDPICGELDHENRTYTMTTEQGEVFVLNVSNGRLIRHVSPWTRYVVSFVVLVPAAVVLIWYRPWVRRLIGRTGRDPFPPATSRQEKRTWLKFSLRSVLVGITLLCAVLAFRNLVVLGALLGTAAAIAGVVALFFRRSFRSFFIGGVLGCYGCILAFLLADLIGSRLFPYGMGREYFVLSSLFAGLLCGAVVAGIIERHSRSFDRIVEATSGEAHR